MIIWFRSVAVAHNALAAVKPSAAVTKTTRVDSSRDRLPDSGTITTSAIKYAVCTQLISSVLADSPPWIWVSELVTIWTSMIAMNWPKTIASTPSQSRRVGGVWGSVAGAGAAGGAAAGATGRTGAAKRE